MNKFVGNGREITVLSELEKFGLKTLKDLDNLITDEFIKRQIISKNAKNSGLNGLLIDLMIVTDYRKYFDQVWTDEHWSVYDKSSAKFYEFYKVPLRELAQKYKVAMMVDADVE